jgi:hypothetical protein
MATRAVIIGGGVMFTAHELVHFQIGVRGSAQECGPEVRSGGSIEPETAAGRRRGQCARLDLRFAIDSASQFSSRRHPLQRVEPMGYSECLLARACTWCGRRTEPRPAEPPTMPILWR